VVGEDSASCKYTVKTPSSNSLLTYNAGTASVAWNDGSLTNPIFLGSNYGSNITAGNFVIGATYSIYLVGSTDFTLIGASTNTVGVIFKATGIGSGSGVATQTSTNQAQQATVGAIQGTTPTGQLVAFVPSTSSEAQFPVIAPNGTTTSWGTIENLVPNTGLVYRNNTGTVAQLSSAAGNIVTFDANGNPIAASASTLSGATAVPSGAVLPFAYNVTSGTVPTGWLLCDGSTYQVSAYPTLGALLANTYGGSTGTFAVPNLSGLFIRGSGTQASGGVSYASGSIGTIQADQFQGHEHNYTGTYSANVYGGGSSTGQSPQAKVTTNDVTDGSDGTPRYGTETRPVNLAMVYCIKI
jgi:hypothetical protein